LLGTTSTILAIVVAVAVADVLAALFNFLFFKNNSYNKLKRFNLKRRNI
jgi:hypothetical protein